MSEHSPRLRGWLVALGLMVTGAARVLGGTAAGDPIVDKCVPDYEGKFGCGHAAAQITHLEDGPWSAQEPGEAYGDSDLTHCQLEIDIDPVAYVITGSNTIDVTAITDGLSQLTLDLRSNMTVDAVTVNSTPAVFTRPGHQILIVLDRIYAPGESFQVRVDYHGTPQNMGWGSFDFGSHNGISMVSTLSEPWGAHTWWPCKESLPDKFTADIWLTVPDWMIAASNGTLQGTDTLSGNRKRYRWHEAHPIDVYLVSIAATNYTQRHYTYTYAGGSMPVEFYLYPESAAAIESHLPTVVTAIETLSQPGVFGQYPFVDEKYGIAQFNWGGGMEHQTITSEGGDAMQADWLNVHELAHQWWGDMITCKTWHDIWLNEGFASYAEAVFEEQRPGGSFAAYQNRMEARRPGSYAGTVYCYDISSTDTIFSGDNSYDKGAWVLHMLRHAVGDANFWNTLAAYRAAFAGGAADTEEFRAVAETVSGRQLDWFFNEWVYGPGAPTYRRGWKQAQIGGQNYVWLVVEQTQTSYPLFTMPIEMRMVTSAGTETHTIWHQAARQWYLLPVAGTVSSLTLDPDTWILKSTRSNIAYVNGPPKLISATPAPGMLIEPYPGVTSIRLQFSEPVDCAPEDFAVHGTRTGPQVFTLDYSAADYVATLTFPHALPGAQTWFVDVANTVKSQAAGLAFDGDMPDLMTMPSGDGLPGGDATFSFVLFGSAVPGDFDHDSDVDGTDLQLLQACATGPGLVSLPISGCTPEEFAAADFDHDGDVDLNDFAVLQRCYSGTDRPANPACAP